MLCGACDDKRTKLELANRKAARTQWLIILAVLALIAGIAIAAVLH
jgi:hypothetical protein